MAKRGDEQEQVDGWTVHTPVKDYGFENDHIGRTAGIRFTDGKAFIRRDDRFPVHRGGGLDGEMTGEQKVRQLVSDFGYRSEPELSPLPKRQPTRHRGARGRKGFGEPLSSKRGMKAGADEDMTAAGGTRFREE